MRFNQAQDIINQHIEYRRQERTENPERFDRKPTLGELAPRSAPVSNLREDTELSQPAPVEKPSSRGAQGKSSTIRAAKNKKANNGMLRILLSV